MQLGETEVVIRNENLVVNLVQITINKRNEGLNNACSVILLKWEWSAIWNKIKKLISVYFVNMIE